MFLSLRIYTLHVPLSRALATWCRVTSRPRQRLIWLQGKCGRNRSFFENGRQFYGVEKCLPGDESNTERAIKGEYARCIYREVRLSALKQGSILHVLLSGNMLCKLSHNGWEIHSYLCRYPLWNMIGLLPAPWTFNLHNWDLSLSSPSSCSYSQCTRIC